MPARCDRHLQDQHTGMLAGQEAMFSLQVMVMFAVAAKLAARRNGTGRAEQSPAACLVLHVRIRQAVVQKDTNAQETTNPQEGTNTQSSC